jgi:hypothetical protein
MIRIAFDFVILHIQTPSCCTRDENKTALVPSYFFATAAKFRMFMERLFHKSGSAALMARSSLDPRAISWAWMNFRNERRTPSHGEVPKRAAAPRPGRTRTETALESDPPSSQPRFEATLTRSGIPPPARNRLARPLMRRHAGR